MKPLSWRDNRSYNRAMASWRCPHCGAPQPETARCWVCRRSTTSCASCRHFRKAVAVKLGYCALDKGRTPIRGDDERACWEPSLVEVGAEPPHGAAAGAGSGAGSRSNTDPGIWGTPAQSEVQPDRAASGHGMWAEPDMIRDEGSGRNQHAGSIRERPWGPVPGHREPASGLRAIRWPRNGQG
jgi:hypothetical protein